MKNVFDIDKLKQELKICVQKLPSDIAVIVENFSLENFKKEGFQVTKNILKKWPDRKKPEPGKNILVQSGNLRRSTFAQVEGNKVVAGNSQEYASYHNDPDENSRLPQRQFIGESKYLEDQIEKHIEKELKKIFK
jgi:phage gpG-like protein